MNTPIVALDGVSKIYGSGDTRVVALDNVSVGFEAGRFTAIMGPSGSGKSTMLHVLAGLDTPSQGSVRIEGREITVLDDDDLTRLRRERIGFVFQSFNLVPTLDAKANMLLPLKLAGERVDPQWFDQIVSALGLSKRLTHRPSELSGGQQQRVAVARALLMRPAVIVADEPTGNLDSRSSHVIMSELAELHEQGNTIIMVTHNPDLTSYASRIIQMRDGRIARDSARKKPVAKKERKRALNSYLQDAIEKAYGEEDAP